MTVGKKRAITLPDILLVSAIAVSALLILAFFYIHDKAAVRQQDKRLVITADGELVGSYPLDEDRIIEIGDTNVCEIRGGRAYMKSADCPDQSCVHSYPAEREGQVIVCLPNKVILEICGGDSGSDGGLDSYAY